MLPRSVPSISNRSDHGDHVEICFARCIQGFAIDHASNGSIISSQADRTIAFSLDDRGACSGICVAASARTGNGTLCSSPNGLRTGGLRPGRGPRGHRTSDRLRSSHHARNAATAKREQALATNRSATHRRLQGEEPQFWPTAEQQFWATRSATRTRSDHCRTSTTGARSDLTRAPAAGQWPADTTAGGRPARVGVTAFAIAVSASDQRRKNVTR
jgi:hypothetical protein